MKPSLLLAILTILIPVGWVYYVQMVYDAFNEDYDRLKTTLAHLEALPLTRQDMVSGIPRHHFLAEAGLGNMEKARSFLPKKGEKLNGPWPHAMMFLNLALILDHDGNPEKATELLHVALSSQSTRAWMSRLPITIKLKSSSQGHSFRRCLLFCHESWNVTNSGRGSSKIQR